MNEIFIIGTVKQRADFHHPNGFDKGHKAYA